MFEPLDRIDRALLALLQKDARFSNKELASQVGLAPSTCLERVRRLRSAGILKGFHADVEPAALGIQLEAMISVRLQRHSREELEAFQAHVRSLPELVSIYHLAGATDFLVHVAVRDTAHLRDLALEAFTTRPEVAHLETALIFQHARGAALPDYGPAEGKNA